jgi:DNA-binding winged helix-turn-helix (wHTH) protein/Tol biopolymer transport system component
MKTQATDTFFFGEFALDGAKRLLLKEGNPVALNSKTFDLLCVLAQRHGQIVTKDELLEQVWAGQFVEENNLTVHISTLRKALGETKNAHRFIVTVPGKGYKFVAEIRKKDEKDKEIRIESHTFSRVTIEEETSGDDEEETAEISAAKRLDQPQNLKTRAPREKVLPKSPVIFYSGAGLILIVFLAAFFFWKTDKTAEKKEFSLAKLTVSGKVSNAALTPDAKYAVFSITEEAGESLWLRHIETGSQTQILPAKTVEYVGLTTSPEGNLIYATVFGGEMPDPQIWRIPLLGGSVEEIRNIKTGAAIGFSPDGKRFAFTESRGALKETHFGIADADGENKQILIRARDEERSFPNFSANPVAWSPDGGEIACVVEENLDGGAKKSGILLVTPDGASERFVSDTRWDYVEYISWLDAETLVFTAFTMNPWQGQIWTISRKTGETRRVTNDLNSYSRISSAAGKILTVQKTAVSHLRVADLDESLQMPGVRDVLSESGYISHAAWTNDGKILYSSTAGGKREIWRADADGANPVQLTVNANVSFGITVSPVDGSIIFSATEDGRYFLVAADREGKNMRRITEGSEDVYPNFTNDGQAIIFQRGLNNKTLTLWRLNIADGQIRQLTETQASHPAVSPDGAQTAHYFMDRELDNLWRIGLISSADGKFLGKLDLPPKTTERRMRWHPNGDFLSQISYRGDRAVLFLIPVRGGSEPREIAELGKGDVNWFEWSKDGAKILVSQSIETQDAVLFESK